MRISHVDKLSVMTNACNDDKSEVATTKEVKCRKTFIRTRVPREDSEKLAH